MKPPSIVDRAVAGGLVLALAGLFCGLSVNTPMGSLKPFDILIILIVGPCLLTRSPHQVRISVGFLLMIVFYLVCTIPSFFANELLYGVRRSVQVLILASFGLILLNVRFDALGRAHYMFALKVMACIVAFNVTWHVANGYLTDWKRLGDPKSLFVFLPACIGVGIVLNVFPRNAITSLIWGLLFVLILMSGERKALPAFLVISLAVFLDLRSLSAFAMVACAGFAVLVLGDLVLDGYIFRRIDSIFAGSDARNDPLYILQGGMPASLSDAQRKLGIQVAMQLFTAEPIFGSGMESTVNYARSHFSNYPKFLTGVAHNEFMRILAEHGLFGMFFMLLPISRTLYYSIIDSASHYLSFGTTAYLRSMIIILVPTFAYMWSEGSGVEMFALVMLAALLPDLMPAIAGRTLPRPDPGSPRVRAAAPA